MRRYLCGLLACISIFSGLCTSAKATEVESQFEFEPAIYSVARATNSFSIEVGAHRTAKANTPFSLAKGEKVIIKASYSPYSENIEVGITSESGIFYHATASDGSINLTINITETGNYSLTFKNTSDVSIKVTGTVNY